MQLRGYISREWLLALSGILSVVFGVLIMVAPIAGALVIAIWFGAYELIVGALLVTLGLRLRAWGKALPSGGSIPATAH